MLIYKNLTAALGGGLICQKIIKKDKKSRKLV